MASTTLAQATALGQWLLGEASCDVFWRLGEKRWSPERQQRHGGRLLFGGHLQGSDPMSEMGRWTACQTAPFSADTRQQMWNWMDDEGALDCVRLEDSHERPETANALFESAMEHWALLCAPVSFWRAAQARVKMSDPAQRDVWTQLWRAWAARARGVLFGAVLPGAGRQALCALADARLERAAREEAGLDDAEMAQWMAQKNSDFLEWASQNGQCREAWPASRHSDAIQQALWADLMESDGGGRLEEWKKLAATGFWAGGSSRHPREHLRPLFEANAWRWLEAVPPAEALSLNEFAAHVGELAPGECIAGEAMEITFSSPSPDRFEKTIDQAERIFGPEAWEESPDGDLNLSRISRSWAENGFCDAEAGPQGLSAFHKSPTRCKGLLSAFLRLLDHCAPWIGPSSRSQDELSHLLVASAEPLGEAFLSAVFERWPQHAEIYLRQDRARMPQFSFGEIEWNDLNGRLRAGLPCRALESLLVNNNLEFAKRCARLGALPARDSFFNAFEAWSEASGVEQTRFARRVRSHFESFSFSLEASQTSAPAPKTESRGASRRL